MAAFTPSVQLTVASTEEHFQQILELQRQNQRDSLTTEEQENQGFVYVQHTPELLKQMAALAPQIVALEQGKVVGYNLAMSPLLQEAVPSLQPMFHEFSRLAYKGRNLEEFRYIVGGQVCVAASHRRQGLLQALYTEMRNQLSSSFELCVTEISGRNTRSLQAHAKAGFEIISSYEADGENWQVVVCDWRA